MFETWHRLMACTNACEWAETSLDVKDDKNDALPPSSIQTTPVKNEDDDNAVDNEIPIFDDHIDTTSSVSELRRWLRTALDDWREEFVTDENYCPDTISSIASATDSSRWWSKESPLDGLL